MDEVGQLITSQMPSCLTASEDESSFYEMDERKCSITNRVVSSIRNQTAAMFSLHRTRRSLVLTISRSYRVSTKNGWNSVLLGNLNRFNLN